MPRRNAVLVRVATSMVLFMGSVCFAGGPARLLKDINLTPSPNRNSSPRLYHRLGDITVFLAFEPDTGLELWRTDGTEAGTALVKDIWPGPLWGLDTFYLLDPEFVALGDRLVFIANDGVHGLELWATDGTESGTRMLGDIRPGPDSPFEIFLSYLDWTHIEADGVMYFPANDGVHGFELWKTDGTEAGTKMVADIYPGVGATDSVSGLVGAAVGGIFYFAANDGVNGVELWKTDGTAVGTSRVADIHPGPFGSYPSVFQVHDGGILFAAAEDLTEDLNLAYDLWKSDGTAAGTLRVKEIRPEVMIEVNGTVYVHAIGPSTLYRTDGSANGTVLLHTFVDGFGLVEINGSLVIPTYDTDFGRELWTSDGTSEGTRLLKDINPGAADSLIGGLWMVIGQTLYFASDDGVHGPELWKSDGTGAGTLLVKDLTPGSVGSFLNGGANAEGRLFFFTEDYSSELVTRLWTSDGTEEGTRRIEGPTIIPIAGAGPPGTLLFTGDDGTLGTELWKSDGTDAGTVMVKDINPNLETSPSDSRFMTSVSIPGVGDRLFFNADDGVHGPALWVSDGTPTGTRLVRGIYPGVSGAVAYKGALYFAAYEPDHGQELWKSDGTEAGTTLVADIFPGPDSGFTYSNPAFVVFHGLLFFGAMDDWSHGTTLWRSDGTAAGTFAMVDVDVEGLFTTETNQLVVGDLLYFLGRDPLHGIELWKSDGTESGSSIVRDIASGPALSTPGAFASLNGKLVFTAFDGSHGYEPWVSDGSDAGTFLLKDIIPGSRSSTSRLDRPQELKGALYFRASGGELWKTDGSEAGTLRVKEVNPSIPFPNIGAPVVSGGVLFFTAGNQGKVTELWMSDGTEAGTAPLKTDFNFIHNLAPVQGGLLFSAGETDQGWELWRSDGTTQGTILAQDLEPGQYGSDPGEFTPLGNRVLFLANVYPGGSEPWVAHTSVLLGQPAKAIQDLRQEVLALLRPGRGSGLIMTLDAAARALSAQRPAVAIIALEQFKRLVDAQTPRRIPEEAAAGLEEFAGDIIGLLEPMLFPKPFLRKHAASH